MQPAIDGGSGDAPIDWVAVESRITSATQVFEEIGRLIAFFFSGMDVQIVKKDVGVFVTGGSTVTALDIQAAGSEASVSVEGKVEGEWEHTRTICLLGERVLTWQLWVWREGGDFSVNASLERISPRQNTHEPYELWSLDEVAVVWDPTSGEWQFRYDRREPRPDMSPDIFEEGGWRTTREPLDEACAPRVPMGKGGAIQVMIKQLLALHNVRLEEPLDATGARQASDEPFDPQQFAGDQHYPVPAVFARSIVTVLAMLAAAEHARIHPQPSSV